MHPAAFALLVAVALVGTSSSAEAGMAVGAHVCTNAVPIPCFGACIETMLSPPDVCPTIRLPV